MERRYFLKTVASIAALSSAVTAAEQKQWKIAVVQDTSQKNLGGHGLETAFRGLPHVEMTALVDSNEKDIAKRIETIQAKRHYKTLAEMYEKEKPDIVVLTSRHPQSHLSDIRYAAEKGSHIYCEKPLAASLEDTDEILKITKQYNTKITIGHPRRYDLGYQTMKKLIENGKIGVPLTMQGWAKNDHRGGGEDMLVLGTHIFDLFVFLFGNPLSVSAEVFVEGKPFDNQPLTKTVEPIGPTAGDEIFAAFRFNNGVHGIFESRRNLYRKNDYRMGISVIGSTGMLSYHFSDAHRTQQPLRFNNTPCAPAGTFFAENIPLKEERVIPNAVPLLEAFGGKENNISLGLIFATARRFAVWDLMQAIQENRQPLCNTYDAQTVMEMIYGVYASQVKRTTITFPLKERTHPLTQNFNPTKNT
ncbi:MAG: Gfo/Idh/MocA family oxidoreductase [Planctomycetaceae bacterium]|jgi:predicted dehydrogenase|nr:Gfo/Idh/MocA family oxidoreductase [Planctomycetaceae bacterium]